MKYVYTDLYMLLIIFPILQSKIAKSFQFFLLLKILVIKYNIVNINLYRLFPNIYTSIKIKNG